jgi:hypothetical protein
LKGERYVMGVLTLQGGASVEMTGWIETRRRNSPSLVSPRSDADPDRNTGYW